MHRVSTRCIELVLVVCRCNRCVWKYSLDIVVFVVSLYRISTSVTFLGFIILLASNSVSYISWPRRHSIG